MINMLIFLKSYLYLHEGSFGKQTYHTVVTENQIYYNVGTEKQIYHTVGTEKQIYHNVGTEKQIYHTVGTVPIVVAMFVNESGQK
jgi:hypothetical protein